MKDTSDLQSPVNSSTNDRGGWLQATLSRYKGLIVGVIALSMVASIVYRWRTVDLYEARAELLAGVVAGNPVEPINSFALRINGAKFKESLLKNLADVADAPSSSTADLFRQTFKIRASADKLELSVRGQSPIEARKLLEHSIQFIIRDQEPRFARQVAVLDAMIESVKAQIAVAQAEVAANNRVLARASSDCAKGAYENVACMSALVLHRNLEGSRSVMKALVAESVDLELKRSASQTRKLEIGDVVSPIVPITPTTLHVIILGAFLGLVLGIFLAIALDSVRRLARRDELHQDGIA